MSKDQRAPGHSPRWRGDDLRLLAQQALTASAVPQEHAATVADCLVEADECGLHSHGLLRLPVYVEALRQGGITADAAPRWVGGTHAVATLDADGGLGQVAMRLACERVQALATELGMGAVAVRGSSHYGAGLPWVRGLAQAGLISLVMSNTGPAMAPHGSREPVLGTNPLSIGLPAQRRHPVVLDMATSTGAYGKVVQALREGRPIPAGWAQEATGEPTTDPAAALEGSLLPFGGHKGSGLAVAIEALTAGLAAARFSFEIRDMWADPSSRMGTGHLVMALDPRAFGPEGEFEARMATLADRIVGSLPAAGFDEIHMPGDVEQERWERSRREGVVLPAEIAAELAAFAGRLGLDMPASLGGVRE